jgi:hypothetical protein
MVENTDLQYNIYRIVFYSTSFYYFKRPNYEWDRYEMTLRLLLLGFLFLFASIFYKKHRGWTIFTIVLNLGYVFVFSAYLFLIAFAIVYGNV